MSVIKDWTAELRSGERTQCRATLKDSKGFCCLGVATDLAINLKVVTGSWEEDNGFYYADDTSEDYKESAALPDDVRRWLGFVHSNPVIEIRFVEKDAELNEFGSWNFLDSEGLLTNKGLPQTSESSPYPSNCFRQAFSLAELNDTGFTFEQIADVIDYFFEDGTVYIESVGSQKANPAVYKTLEFQECDK
jgi:hypothetical protein